MVRVLAARRVSLERELKSCIEDAFLFAVGDAAAMHPFFSALFDLVNHYDPMTALLPSCWPTVLKESLAHDQRTKTTLPAFDAALTVFGHICEQSTLGQF